MKVLQTIAGFGALYGGIATCTYDLIRAMYNIGFPLDLLTLEVRNPMDKLMGKGEDWIKALPNDAITPYEYSKSIALYLKNKEYDLYHTNGLWMYCNHATCSIARRKHKPYIFTYPPKGTQPIPYSVSLFFGLNALPRCTSPFLLEKMAANTALFS